MTKGQTSPLIRTASGFAIIHVNDSRISGQVASPEDAQVTLSTLTLPIPKDKDAPGKQQLLQRAAQLTAPARSCPEFEAIGRKFGANVATIADKRVGEIEGPLRRQASALPVQRPGEPSETADGIQVVMVCERVESLSFKEPTREQVRRQIEDERMDMLSRRYLRNLRRQAFVDIRI